MFKRTNIQFVQKETQYYLFTEKNCEKDLITIFN